MKKSAKNKIKAVIFDMDGVLIDAKDWHFEALNRALGLFGFTISRYEHFVTYDGLPTREKLKMLSRERTLPEGLHAFLNELKQIYTTELIHARCRPVFQHEYALSHLKKSGYKLGLASNSVRATVELMMEKSSLARYLDAVVSNQDVAKPKPDPEIYAKTCHKLGVSPSNTLAVEDNDHGVRSAKAAGVHVMVVKTPADVTLQNIAQNIARLEAA